MNWQFLIGIIVGVVAAILGLLLWRKPAPKTDSGILQNLIQEIPNKINSLIQESTKLQGEIRLVDEKVRDVLSFQNIFKQPQLRGKWGEKVSLEHMLAQYYPRERYGFQHSFANGERVDACLKLPDGRIVPIDVKFPLDNFENMIKATNEAERATYHKNFVNDVRTHIDDIAKKYVLPSEKTTDYALMYIPAEAIYYEIINPFSEEDDLAREAWKKKVVMVSPNTLYLALNTIQHWISEDRISHDFSNIISPRLARIGQDAATMADEFRKIGKHLDDARSAYESLEKRISTMVDRVHRLTSGKAAKELAPEE